MSLFRKNSGSSGLYQGYLKEQEDIRLEEERRRKEEERRLLEEEKIRKKKNQRLQEAERLLKEAELEENRRCLEMERKRRLEEERGRILKSPGRHDIFVCSLAHGSGVTYISAAIANYFASKKKRTVLVGGGETYVEGILQPGVELSSGDGGTGLNQAECIVQDGGVFGEMTERRRLSMNRAGTVIIVSHADDESMRRLASFVESRGDVAQTYLYMFNVLPKEWEKKVKKSMVDFYYCCMPLFYAPSPDAGTKAVFDRIFGGKRGRG